MEHRLRQSCRSCKSCLKTHPLDQTRDRLKAELPEFQGVTDAPDFLEAVSGAVR